MDQPFTGGTAVGLVVGLVAVSCLIAWQTYSITRSEHPRLRAVEALASSFPLFILLFATAYFLMNRSQPGDFTQPMSRTDALYFTVTVFSTVGFGDITAKSEPARTVVTVQMLGDLFIVGVAARIILGAVRIGLDHHAQTATPGEGGGFGPPGGGGPRR